MAANVLRNAKIANVYCNTLIEMAIAFDCRPIPELPDGSNDSRDPKGYSARVHHPAGWRQEPAYDKLVLEAQLRKGPSRKEKLAKAQARRRRFA